MDWIDSEIDCNCNCCNCNPFWILLDQPLKWTASAACDVICSREYPLSHRGRVEFGRRHGKPLMTEPFQKECSATGRFISRGVEVELNAFWTSTRLKNVPWSRSDGAQSNLFQCDFERGLCSTWFMSHFGAVFFTCFFLWINTCKYVFLHVFCMHRRMEVDDARNSNSVNSVLPSLSGSLQEPRSGRILRAKRARPQGRQAPGSHGTAVGKHEEAEATRHTCTNLDRQQTATRLTNSKHPANVEELWIVSSSYLRMISWCILIIKCTSVCNQSDLRTLGLTRDFLVQKSSL